MDVQRPIADPFPARVATPVPLRAPLRFALPVRQQPDKWRLSQELTHAADYQVLSGIFARSGSAVQKTAAMLIDISRNPVFGFFPFPPRRASNTFADEVGTSIAIEKESYLEIGSTGAGRSGFPDDSEGGGFSSAFLFPAMPLRETKGS
ncbi:hypothetical protein [Chitiniphilus shinanonensis]|uniref:hypothetical protein n=1 Tax=Chitiniphilus shinanonensis TaxID=553088 RepID=UPI003341DC0F